MDSNSVGPYAKSKKYPKKLVHIFRYEGIINLNEWRWVNMPLKSINQFAVTANKKDSYHCKTCYYERFVSVFLSSHIHTNTPR